MAIDVGEAVGYLRLDTQDFAEGLIRSESDLKQFSGITEQLGNGITSFGDSLAKTGTKMTAAFTTPIVAAGKKAIDAYRDFESAFTGVKKTLDVTDDALREFGGSADDAYATLKTAIEGMATSTASSAEEIAHVMEISGQLGVPLGRAGKDIIGFTDTMVKLGDTTDLSATEAAEALAKFMNITGTTWDEVDNLGSAIVDLGNNFATNESDIVNMSTRLASAGTVAGLTEQEILALSTAMSSVGIRAEMGGSAMSQTLAQIEKAVQKALAGDEGAIPMLNKLAEVSGMTSEEFATTWETRPIEALQSFLLGLGDLEDKGESTVLVLDEVGMTGIRQSNMLRSLALAGGVLTDAINTSNEAWTLNKAMMNEAELRYGTLDSKINMVKESVKMVARDIAEILLPTFEKMLDGILKAVETWQSLDKEEKEAIIRIAAVVAAIGPLLLVFGKLTSGVGTVVTAFGKIMGVFDMFSGKTGIITGVMDKLHIKLKDTHNEASMFSEGFANAMGGAASSASAFGQTVVNTAGDVSEFDGSLSRTIKTSGSANTSIGSMLGTLLKGGAIIAAVVAAIALLVAGFIQAYKSSEEVRNAVSQLFGVMQRFFTSVIAFAKQLWEALKPVIDAVVNIIAKLIEILLPPLVKMLSAIQSVLEVMLPIIGKVLEVIGKIAAAILNVLGPILEWVVNIIAGIVDAIAGFIESISNFVKKLFHIKDDFKKSGKDAGEGFSEGIKEGEETSKSAIRELGESAKGMLSDTLGISDGKSSVFEGFGLDIGDGFASGIDSGTETVVASVDNMGTQVESSFRSHQERMNQYYDAEIADWQRYIDETLASYQELYEAGRMSEEEYQQAVVEIRKQGNDAILELENQRNNELIALNNEANSSYEQQLEGHLSRIEQRHQSNLDAIEVQTQASVDRINQEYNQGYITREQMLEQVGVSMQVKQERIDAELLKIREEKNAEQEYMEKIHAQEMESIQIGSAQDIKDQKIRIDNEYLESDKKYTEESKKNTKDMTAENIAQVATLATSIASTAATMWTPLVMITANSSKQIQDIINTMVANVSNSLNAMATSIRSTAGAFNSMGVSINGSHSAGLDYVPFNGYVAQLHQGERVLTKEEAREYNNNDNGNNGGDTFVFYDTKNDPYEQARAFKRVKKEMAFG